MLGYKEGKVIVPALNDEGCGNQFMSRMKEGTGKVYNLRSKRLGELGGGEGK